MITWHMKLVWMQRTLFGVLNFKRVYLSVATKPISPVSSWMLGRIATTETHLLDLNLLPSFISTHSTACEWDRELGWCALSFCCILSMLFQNLAPAYGSEEEIKFTGIQIFSQMRIGLISYLQGSDPGTILASIFFEDCTTAVQRLLTWGSILKCMHGLFFSMCK